MKDHENESALEAEGQLQTKAYKKDRQDGILLPILYSLLAAIGGFTLVMLIGIAMTLLNGPSQPATAAVPSQAVTRPEGITQSSYQYFKEKAAEEAANLPPVQTEGPSTEPSEELLPDPERSAPPAPVQSADPTPAPTRSPSTATSEAPAQTTSPVVPSVRPVQQNPTQSGNHGGGGNSITNEITGDLARTSYWVDSGYSYHFSSGCRSLARSTNIHRGTLQDALNAGKTDPCNNCAGGN